MNEVTTAARRAGALAALALLSTGCMAHGVPFAQAAKPVAREGEAVLYTREDTRRRS